MSTLALDEVRGVWAATARCPRWGHYLLAGAPAEVPTDLDERRWRRGRECEAYVIEQLRARFGGNGAIDTTRLLDWPGGKAHPDALVLPEALTVEVKSRADVTAGPYDHEIVQVAGYVEFDPDSERGAIIVVSPVDYEERVVPVTLHDALKRLVAERVERLELGEKSGQAPERVCEKPADGRSLHCPFIEHCFAGWQEPEPIVVEGEVARLARSLYYAEVELDTVEGLAAAAKATRDALRTDLRELTEPGREYDLLGIRVKRSVYEKTSYRASEAIKCGSLDPAQLDAHKTVSEQERWTVTRLVDDLPPVPSEDYGEVPF